ncbi:ABC transporter permease [Mesorhizobium sp.]|uniref:ABC transporter permease n=1 Tax=Mesorhizobium sp. TaxID=1871066 RepID=UPI0012019B3C|nr:ABC transporter permease [Mesorhizobium sp.]TIP18357.1 MAG: ABC transporter permease [Mesorhizobium sp.]
MVHGLTTDDSLSRRSSVTSLPWMTPILWFAALFVIWEVSLDVVGISDYLVPRPSQIFARIIHESGFIWPNLLDSLLLIGIGFTIGAAVAIPLAFIISVSPFLERSLYPLILLFQIAPKIAFLPLLIIWLGFGHTSAITLTVMFVVFPILVDSLAGFKSVDRDIFYISRSMGASWWQTLFLIRLPAALPHIFSGLKVSIVLSVTSVIIAEYIGSNNGIGYLVLRAVRVSDIPLVFALLFCAALVGIVLNYGIRYAESALMPWVRHLERP